MTSGRMERRHDQVALENPHQRYFGFELPRGRLQMPLPLEPDRALRHRGADPEREEGRDDRNPEHDAPSDVGLVAEDRIDELKGRGREQIAPVPPAEQHAGHEPAQARRPMLDDERHAGRPFAAHADAEQRAKPEEHRVRRGEPAQKRKQREPQDRQHHRQLAAPSIRGRAGDGSANQAHQQRHGREQPRQPAIDREAVGDVDDDEREDVEVERVNDPADERGPEGAPLLAC